jgi:ABC-2 type transport system permease protein
MRVIHALWVRNLKAFVRNKPALIFNLLFPLFFVFVLRGVFANEYVDNTETFILAGIIMATIFDSSLRISASTIEDITSGFMKEVLVSPVSRLTIAAGQFISSATVAVVQGLIILIVGFFIGFRVSNPMTVISALLAMMFTGLVFAGFGLLIATRAKNMQTFQAVSIAVTMPMTFLSGAYLPISVLPSALQWVAYFNPMTYAVSMFRAITMERLTAPASELVNQGLAFEIGTLTVGPGEAFLILLIFGALFLFLSTLAFVKTDFSKMNRSKEDYLEI